MKIHIKTLDALLLPMGSSVTYTQDELFFLEKKNIDALKIESTQDIPIKNYLAPDKPVLNQIVLHPVVEVQFKASFINPLWNCSSVFLERRTSWSGYMGVNADGQPLGKSVLFNLSAVFFS